MIEKLMTKKSEEPTMTELYDSMNRSFSYFEERFNLVDARMDQRFGLVDDKLMNLDSRIDLRLTVIERDLNNMKLSLADLQDDVTSLGAAFDRDSMTLLDHGKRIKRLEKVAMVA
jgi:hypothetical protein